MNHSSLKPELDARGIALAGVGLEPLGVKEFVEGGYFDGDLYIDINKQCYKVCCAAWRMMIPC